jgi:hypothetical protein
MTKDSPVRYSPSHGFWRVSLPDTTHVRADDAARLLAQAMFWARDADSALEGCTCDPGDQYMDGPRLRTPSLPIVHVVEEDRSVLGGVFLIGHGGPVVPQGSVTKEDVQGRTCPLRNVDGERQARELMKAGHAAELKALTEPFPAGAGPLAPLEPGQEAPEAWDGEGYGFRADGRQIRIPGRHLHPEARAALDAYRDLAAKVADLKRAARAAEEAHRMAPQDLRRRVAQAAISGRSAESFDAAKTLRDLELEAQAAHAVADGMADALEAKRRDLVAAVQANRTDWLAYLGGQGRAALARYQAAVAELEAAAQEVVAVDTMRANVERPVAPGGTPFGQSSTLAGKSGVGTAQEFISLAAETLAPLSRHAAAAPTKTTRRPAKAASNA